MTGPIGRPDDYFESPAPSCSCTPLPHGTGPEADCDVHGQPSVAYQQGVEQGVWMSRQKYGMDLANIRAERDRLSEALRAMARRATELRKRYDIRLRASGVQAAGQGQALEWAVMGYDLKHREEFIDTSPADRAEAEAKLRRFYTRARSYDARVVCRTPGEWTAPAIPEPETSGPSPAPTAPPEEN